MLLEKPENNLEMLEIFKSYEDTDRKKAEKRLSNISTSKWKKADWILAATILSSHLKSNSPLEPKNVNSSKLELRKKINSH